MNDYPQKLGRKSYDAKRVRTPFCNKKVEWKALALLRPFVCLKEELIMRSQSHKCPEATDFSSLKPMSHHTDLIARRCILQCEFD